MEELKMNYNFRNINVITVMEINKLLDALVERDGYELEMGDITIVNQGTVEDTANGKRQIFQLIRKVDNK